MNHNFRELKIWQKGMELSKAVYGFTESFPSEEKFGLISQMRRAVISIPSNIAEGSSRNSEREFKQFLSYAIGSLYELETQITLSSQLNFCTNEKTEIIVTQIRELIRMINGFVNSLHIINEPERKYSFN